ncbi:Uncharacterized protein Fot_24325 [Forsythia ovata]|uniref:Uncharacterized protein n=1 Tax=Forsythia ovata TaxID=205694 RepID=A0ABD1U5W7_9LAMI
MTLCHTIIWPFDSTKELRRHDSCYRLQCVNRDLKFTAQENTRVSPRERKAIGEKETKGRERENRRPGRPSLSLPGRCEYINIGARQDKLDPSVVEKLPPAVALAATSVHKYWTSSFGKAADTAEVTELMKLAKMYTSRSHVLNCELYKMLEMKVDEIHSVLGEDEDAEAMRAKIKRLRT